MSRKSWNEDIMFVIPDTDSVEGYAIIVPSVSFGNVGQLAVDLLIRETQAVKLGNAWHPAVFTVVGANPFEDSSSEIATGIEVYRSEKDKLICLQIRGPIIKEWCSNFLQGLIQEIKKYKIDRVFILTGADDAERKDTQIQETTVKCVVSPSLAAREKIYQNSSEEEVSTTDNIKVSEVISDDLGYRIVGCGYAKLLYSLCVKNELQTAVLIKQCSEGYNIPDAVAVVVQLNKWLHFAGNDAGNLKSVSSWRYVFGRAEQRSIF